MTSPLKRWLAAGLTGGVVAALLAYGGFNRPTTGALDAGTPKGGGQNWTMYGGTNARNMVNAAAKGLPVKWDIENKENVRWSADLGSKAYGGPIVAGGKVVIGTNNQNPRDKKYVDPKSGQPIDLGVLMAFEEGTGKFMYQTVFPKLAAGRVNDWPLEGLCSTPVVENDRMYYVSNRCEVICSDLATGKIHWKQDMIKNLNVFPHNIAACSPLIAGDDLWLVTANGVDEGHINVPAPKAPSFLKLNKSDGKPLWEDNRTTIALTIIPKAGQNQQAFFKNLVNRGELIQHGQWSNPAYAVVGGQPQVVFPGGDGWIYSFNPADGKLIWKFDCNPKDSKYELAGRGTRSDFIATPVVYKNRVYIGVGQDPEHETGVGHLWCIDMTKKGDVSPELVTNNAVWPPETKKNPNSAMVWHYGGPIADPAQRAKLGRNNVFGRTMSTCAIHDGLCYASELLGILHCLDAETGKAYWTHDTGAPIWSSPYWADGKVYMGTDDGSVFVFAHGKQKNMLAQNTMESGVRATPVAANGTLFVMTENKLYAIAEKK
jgi:outer membrane protein assembly factor BamB